MIFWCEAQTWLYLGREIHPMYEGDLYLRMNYILLYDVEFRDEIPGYGVTRTIHHLEV